MSKSIPLSPKHGLNPTIPVCFFCGQPRNEVALLGKIPAKKHTVNTAWGSKSTVVDDPDPEAPMHCIIDLEPCEKCAAQMKQGYTALGVSHTPRFANQPEVQPSLYLTGSYLVFSEQGVRRIFTPEAVEQILEARKFCLDQEVLEHFMQAAREAESAETDE